MTSGEGSLMWLWLRVSMESARCRVHEPGCHYIAYYRLGLHRALRKVVEGNSRDEQHMLSTPVPSITIAKDTISFLGIVAHTCNMKWNERSASTNLSHEYSHETPFGTGCF
jgi:hypothetical protein